jgi:hypothetical protein
MRTQSFRGVAYSNLLNHMHTKRLNLYGGVL